jgi:HEAT repeat protein
MKQLCFLVFCAAALAAESDPTGRMLNEKLTAAQRNDACVALQGDRSPEVLAALRAALSSGPVRMCAGRNLREAGAVGLLTAALSDPAPEVRAVAARELGSFQRADLVAPLAKAAHDSNALVATNAVMSLAKIHDAAVMPQLLDLAGREGMVGVAAMSRAAEIDEAATLPVARHALSGSDMAVKLVALKVIGESGDRGDLPRLKELAVKSEPLTVRGRGFGLLPPIDLGRAAKAAMDSIEKRLPSSPI